MSGFFVESSHMPCTECGASLAAAERETHACEPQRLLEYRLFQLRDEVAGLEDVLRGYLDSQEGHFAQWLAERERRGGASA